MDRGDWYSPRSDNPKPLNRIGVAMSNLQVTAPVPKSALARNPSPRSIRVLTPGRVVITEGWKQDEYTVSEMERGDFDGRRFRCEGFGGGVYDVFLARNGQDSYCECLWFLHRGECRHVSGLTALLHRG